MKNLSSIIALTAGLALAVNGCSRTIERDLNSNQTNKQVVRYENDPLKRDQFKRGYIQDY